MEGNTMKKLTKIAITIIGILLSIFALIEIFNIETNGDKVYAASNNSSDLQLIARAINGEARGEPYEGQVAVRCSYFKPSKKLKISKHNSRSYI